MYKGPWDSKGTYYVLKSTEPGASNHFPIPTLWVKTVAPKGAWLYVGKDESQDAIWLQISDDDALMGRVEDLENTYVTDNWFASISDTTGTITPSTGASFVLDFWPGGVDAIISHIGTDGRPDWEHALDSDGDILSTTLASNGAYALSGTPVDEHVALVYRYRCHFEDYSDTYSLDRMDIESCLKLDQSTPQTITGGKPTVQGFQFNATDPVEGTFQEGKLVYDTSWKTLKAEIGYSGHVHIGQEDIRLVYNDTGSTIYKGESVYTTGSYTAGIQPTVTVAKAKADSPLTYFVLGLAQTDILTGHYGFIVVRGHIKDIKTDNAGWAEGSVLYLSPSTAGALTTTQPVSPNYEVRIGRVITVGASTGMINVRLSSAATGSYEKYHGVETIGTLSFDDTTHILTVSSITYWYQGAGYSGTNITCDIDTYQTLTANTLYYFYFDGSAGVLKCGTSFPNMRTTNIVATVFWNGSTGAVQKEYHGYTRDLDWHTWAHQTIGARYGSGLSLTNPTAVNDALLQIESGSIWDEDLMFTISGQTTCRILYKVNASTFTFVNSSLPYAGSSGQPQYLDTDTYTLTNVPSNQYACYWIYASGDTSRPIWIIPSHVSAPYSTVANARLETAPSLSNFNINTEIKLIYKWIYKGDGQFQESTDYRSSSPLPGGGTSSTTASSVSFSPTGNISSTTVQTALEELDRETNGKRYLRWMEA